MADVYMRPLFKRDGGEVILKEKHLRDFYALRFAMRPLRVDSINYNAAYESLMTLARMSGTAVANAMGDWEALVYDELMDCAQECAAKGLRFADFEEHLIGDYLFTIAVEVEDEEDDDE